MPERPDAAGVDIDAATDSAAPDAGESDASAATDGATSDAHRPVSGCGITLSGPARWELAAPMAEARTQHTATLLKNGKVLVVGGLGGSVSNGADLASAELYDPCTNSWSPAGSMAQARNGPGTALLRDGRVLVEGGSYQGFSVATAELYDPSTNSWSPAAPGPGPGALIPLVNGLILLIGADVVDNTSALYDPATDRWSPTGIEAHPRSGFEVTTLDSGRVLISGGFSIEPYSPAVLEAEQYDPASATWSPAGTLSRMRNGSAPVRLRSGRVLISGGYPQAPTPTPPASTEIYDPRTNAWSAGKDMQAARWIHSSTLLSDGRVLLAGGSFASGANSAFTSAELYDESSGEYSLTAPLKVARGSHTATMLPDGRVLVVGGNDGTDFLDSVEVYTPGPP